MANEAISDAPTPEQPENVHPSAAIPATAPGLPAWCGIALVLALTFAVYLPTLRYQFVHDDRGQIVENPAVHSWHAVPTYFTAHVWAAVMPEEEGNYYRPLFLLWLRLNDAVFGTQAWALHLTTVLAHVLATLLVYLLALRLGTGRDVALLAALIFGLHPAHIEAVAWVSGVTEPLLGILLIGSLLAYLRARDAGPDELHWKIISLVLFALAMLEKETALILPGLLLAYEWIFGAEWERPFELRRAVAWCGEALRKIWPYFLLVALYVPARVHALKGFSHSVTAVSAEQLVFTWPSLIEFWIRHLIWPAGLSTFYDFPAVDRPDAWNFIFPVIFDVCIGLVLFVAARTSRIAAFCAVWLVLPFIPLLNLRVFIANDFAHDRYLYLPSVGLAILVALLLKQVCTGPARWQGVPTSLLAVEVLLAILMSYGTLTQTFYFHDNLTFYAYNLARAPHNRDAESNYATVLAEAGQFNPALEIFRDVVSHHPDYYAATYNMGLTYYKMGKYPEAEDYFFRAIRINPHKPDEYFYMGLARLKSGRTADAIPCLQQAIAIRPNGYAYHFALGAVLKSQGDLSGALQEFKEELANNPGEEGAAMQVREIESQLHAQPGTTK